MKVLTYSRDVGGTHAVLPVIKKLQKKYEVVTYGRNLAVDIYESEDIFVNNIDKINQNVDDYKLAETVIENEKPQLVITGTSTGDFIERYIWEISEKLKIPSFAILDNWMNYGIRFSKYDLSEYEKYNQNKCHKYLPTKILVMDEYAKNKMLQEGIEAGKICITGQPHFEYLENKIKSIDKSEKVDSDKLKIIFASEPLEDLYGSKKDAIKRFGYTETTILEDLIDALKEISVSYGKYIELVIKPHPREDKNKYEKYVCNKNEELFVRVDEKDTILKAISEADIICGMTSMFLVEAAYCNKKTLSIQINRNQNNVFILEELGILKAATTKEELKNIIINYILHSFILIETDFIRNASDRILKLVEEFI